MLLDIGVGILSSFFVSKVFDVHLTWMFVCAGILFSLLADSDFLVHLGRGKGIGKAHEHRDLLHLPLLYIPLGMIALYFFSPAGLAVSVLFGITSFLHFLHDSIGIGWGVKWLYPFKKDGYSFFYHYTPKGTEKHPRKLFYIWKDGDIAALSEKYGDENWVKNIYYNWHPYAIVEFSVFVIAIVALFLYFK